jgi:DNA-binding NarL/FixJ family response regulator
MDLVVAGHPNKVVANRLGIAVRTVEIHRARVMDKTEARNLRNSSEWRFADWAQQPFLRSLRHATSLSRVVGSGYPSFRSSSWLYLPT